MPRVLIASDDGFPVSFVEAYEAVGWDVVRSREEFMQTRQDFDLVHCFYPEEYTGFQVPTIEKIARVEHALEYWQARSVVIMSVLNLRPHVRGEHTLFRRLYEHFMEATDGFQHYSKTSVSLLQSLYPTTQGRLHAVTGYFAYPNLLQKVVDRTEVRRAFGFADSDFVLLVFGAIRTWEEVRLIMDAFDCADLPNRRLLGLTRFLGTRRSPRGLYHRWKWAKWCHKLLRERRGHLLGGYVPEEKIPEYLSAADAVIVPRINQLTSGILGLGLTFGKVVIAPNHGAFPEYLAGTDNVLYRAGDSRALASAICQAAAADQDRICRQNQAIMRSTPYSMIVARCLELYAAVAATKGT